jgi:tetratricopeptide (TPR) repeat protein
LPEGLADYEHAARVFAELGQRREHTTVRFNMVPVLARLGRVDEALAIGRECSKSFHALGDRRGEGAVLGSLGQILRGRAAFDEALQCSDLALECFRSAADRVGEARELSFQGHTLRAMKRMPDALDRFTESAKLAEESGERLLVGSAYYALAEMTPPMAQFAGLGLENARRAARAYREAGRDDLAADAEQLAKRFAQ